ncbi:MAG: hypothetical protein HYR55_11925 [Acidobacteria bacterium]|nr:hypothetical protein [Acidobacteriota bacterium]MBI3655875.1 hypothetical protein [Acidobacteriota bacterium]
MISLSSVYRRQSFTELSRWGATFLFFAMIGASSAFAQDEIAVVISTDREVYSVGEAVPVNYMVINGTGETIHIKSDDCVPLFNLTVVDLYGQEVWNSGRCPSCCCTCCDCPIRQVSREIPPGKTLFRHDTTWLQRQTIGERRCGCGTEAVGPGTFYMVGQALDAESDLIIVEIR